MPTYHYRCKSCSHEFEELQKISEAALVVCPSCHKHTLVRVIGGGAGLVFKGSGFYLTDYKKKPTDGESKPSAKKESTEKKSESKSTSKPTTDSDRK